MSGSFGCLVKVKKWQMQIQSVLESKKVPFELVDVAADEKARDHMRKVSGKSAVPQVFVDGKFKGVRQYRVCALILL